MLALRIIKVTLVPVSNKISVGASVLELDLVGICCETNNLYVGMMLSLEAALYKVYWVRWILPLILSGTTPSLALLLPDFNCLSILETGEPKTFTLGLMTGLVSGSLSEA